MNIILSANAVSSTRAANIRNVAPLVHIVRMPVNLYYPKGAAAAAAAQKEKGAKEAAAKKKAQADTDAAAQAAAAAAQKKKAAKSVGKITVAVHSPAST